MRHAPWVQDCIKSHPVRWTVFILFTEDGAQTWRGYMTCQCFFPLMNGRAGIRVCVCVILKHMPFRLTPCLPSLKPHRNVYLSFCIKNKIKCYSYSHLLGFPGHRPVSSAVGRCPSEAEPETACSAVFYLGRDPRSHYGAVRRREGKGGREEGVLISR